MFQSEAFEIPAWSLHESVTCRLLVKNEVQAKKIEAIHGNFIGFIHHISVSLIGRWAQRVSGLTMLSFHLGQ